ncbi:heavy metal translocating P-type ATPase metal-binding domain-containing protein [Opitutus sp. ER46]|uniref:heavy metal translocating P-type ATPase n=1 Tax=Opitutus sp. ER46 TaxID=2161864 RepID=UPI000D2F906D|nr:heavy metal translocating P-type ATPase metal-binding domain-containing protein [Opitutus sp. ER46]PTX95534.1 ATPase P [Opitutus sp. ER46]
MPAISPDPVDRAAAAEKSPRPVCRHCGATLIDARMVESGFCCAGCRYVFRLVQEQGLGTYYEIKDDVTAPADAAVFQPRDYTWLEAAQREAEASPRIPELVVNVQGLSCAACVWLIERVFQQQPGGRDILVNAPYGTMRLRWVRGVFSAAEFARRLQTFGYVVGPMTGGGDDSELRGLVRRIGLCAAFAMNVMLYALPAYFGMEPSYEWAGLFSVLAFAFGTLSFLVGGTYFLGRAWHALRARAMHIDLPIALGVLGAYAGSVYGWFAGAERFVYFDFVATFILLMLVGRWAQTAAVERNRRRLLNQQPTLPPVRLATGETVPPAALEAGREIVLLSGQALPVESRLESAAALFSLSSINGESEAREFRRGQRVPAGAISVARGELRLTTLQGWSESLLAELLRPAERPGERADLLERIVQGYIIGILLVATLAGVGWWLATQDALRTGAVVTAVLVVSCPCAIGLAFPLADEIATVALRRRGVFVRESDLWLKLARVRRVVFDKTGTLTLETPTLLNPESVRSLEPGARSALLALVWDNAHPVSECLREELLATGAVEPLAGELRETIGAGVEIEGWSLGRPGWRAPAGVDAAAQEGAVDTVLARDGTRVASFHFADRPRADAVREIEALQARGLPVYMLSGDREEKVQALARELGLPAAQAVGSASPREKAAWVAANGAAEMLLLGDGANDSLAFDAALCRGTPVIHRGVLEQKADFYYLGRGIAGIRALFEVDAVRRRTHRVILVFSVAYNALAVGLAVAGQMNPLLAAALMPLNSLLTLALVTGGMRPTLRRG